MNKSFFHYHSVMFNRFILKIAYHTYAIYFFKNKYILCFPFDNRLQSVQSSFVCAKYTFFYSEIMNVSYKIAK